MFSYLKHDALEDRLVADLAGVVTAEVEQGDGGAVWIPARQDCELPLAQLSLQGAAAVVKEGQALPKSALRAC